MPSIHRLIPSILFILSLSASVTASASEATVKPYPFKTCIVTDNDLGSMGDEKVIIYEGQEIKFCCAPCDKKFRKNPAKYLKKPTPPALPEPPKHTNTNP
jgi:hypothetical protein